MQTLCKHDSLDSEGRDPAQDGVYGFFKGDEHDAVAYSRLPEWTDPCDNGRT
jgi:hypothetical protein